MYGAVVSYGSTMSQYCPRCGKMTYYVGDWLPGMEALMCQCNRGCTCDDICPKCGKPKGRHAHPSVLYPPIFTC